jgi:hypothetical protein
MNGLPDNPVPHRDISDRRAVQHLKNRPIPLLHHIQLHQHSRLPPPRLHRRNEAKQALQEAEPSMRVAHLPKRLSPTNRNRVHNLSPTNRNPGVKHEPEKHTRADLHARDHQVI